MFLSQAVALSDAAVWEMPFLSLSTGQQQQAELARVLCGVAGGQSRFRSSWNLRY